MKNMTQSTALNNDVVKPRSATQIVNEGNQPRLTTTVNNTVDERSLQASEEKNKWWKFKITDEQARAWQYGDVNAAKQFYEENKELLQGIARHYYKPTVIDRDFNYSKFYAAALIELQRKYEYSELLAQIYADLMDYRFYDSHSLYVCITRSCIGLVYGGYKPFCKVLCDIAIHSRSLDEPIGEDGDDELIDIIADSKTIDDYVEQRTTAMSKAFENTLDQIANMLYPRPQDELKRLEFIRRF